MTNSSAPLVDVTGSSSARFRLVFGLYVGVLVGGVAASVGAAQFVSSAALAAIFLGGLAIGGVVAVVIARVDERLPIRLGRSRPRRALLVLPGIPGLLGAATVASSWSPIASTFVTTGSSIALLVVGYVLGELARTGYTEAVAAGGPTDSWRWTPPGGGTAYTLVALGWLVLAVINAADGTWTAAVVWMLITLGWIVGGLVEGRWQTRWGATPEIRVHENGLVKHRPFTKSFVSWDEVSHVRLHEDELVLDRGLFDVRLERAELADLEAVREAIERRLETAGTDARLVP